MYKSRIQNGALTAVLWIGTLFVWIPYALVLITSFKTSREAGLFRLTLPTEWHIIENYKLVFERGDIMLGFFNSIMITGCATALILFCSLLLSYYLSRTKSRLSGWLYISIVAGMTAPMSLVTT